jgi:putative ABC transport system ATP-binding protein
MGFRLENVLPIPLHDWDFEPNSIWKNTVYFKPEEKHLLASPSGKGKSTLISLLFGLRKDYTGDIYYKEKKLKSVKPDEWAILRRNELSILHQELKLFGQLTVWENFEIKNRLTAFKTKNEIEELAVKLGIESLLNRQCSTLSLGQQQRVAIVRSLLQPFNYLLMDEPFSHIDEGNIKKALAVIEEECAINEAGYILTSLGDTYGINYATQHIV